MNNAFVLIVFLYGMLKDKKKNEIMNYSLFVLAISVMLSSDKVKKAPPNGGAFHLKQQTLSP